MDNSTHSYTTVKKNVKKLKVRGERGTGGAESGIKLLQTHRQSFAINETIITHILIQFPGFMQQNSIACCVKKKLLKAHPHVSHRCLKLSPMCSRARGGYGRGGGGEQVEN